MTLEVHNINHVVSVNGSGTIVAEAIRQEPGQCWKIWTMYPGEQLKMVATVSAVLDEVEQRRAVLSILKAMS